jgi:hypothetical protein
MALFNSVLGGGQRRSVTTNTEVSMRTGARRAAAMSREIRLPVSTVNMTTSPMRTATASRVQSNPPHRTMPGSEAASFTDE